MSTVLAPVGNLITAVKHPERPFRTFLAHTLCKCRISDALVGTNDSPDVSLYPGSETRYAQVPTSLAFWQM